jgi:hypothetical protein
MSSKNPQDGTAASEIPGSNRDRPQAAAPGKTLSPAAVRALQEAQARREAEAGQADLEPELGGRKGPEPTRYGDWEKKGILSDF